MTSIEFIIKSAQHRSTNLHLHYYSTQEPSNIFFLPSHIVYVMCFLLFGHIPSLSLFEPHRCAQAKTAAAIPAAIVARCPLRIKHCIEPIAQCLLPTTLCPSITAHYPLPIAWPGGMRGAIEYGQPLAGSAVWEHRSRNAEAEAVSASAKRSMRPSRIPPGLPWASPFPPLRQTTFGT